MKNTKATATVSAALSPEEYLCLLREAARQDISISALMSDIIGKRYGLRLPGRPRRARKLNKALAYWVKDNPRPITEADSEYFHHLFYENGFPGLRKHYLEVAYVDENDWRAAKVCYDDLNYQRLQMIGYKPDMADKINAFFREWENKLNTEKPKGVK